ncbi:ribosomal protein S15 [Sphaerochaeta pleomorpha str. Grapes]|uniref:Small ribosomal subunit protein uS15 n=1 Tax=Sphaerochaeta pleomorpha (strain ATCC BAA-1885 / DSM 22778 / Grapes) TaxID=158190 RepID=G8QW28_SPHPG|nr:30S ribosomal protein S15 [Sphaerochaeta pleomorpha]AEV28271.1 ribosomal protein S15 [Sphaerochaeta pleomorpha str. Grapes]
MISKEQKQEIITKFGGDAANTGSTQAQIALLTYRINELQPHFKRNPKDNAGIRGLLKMVGQRRRLLKYLKNNDIEAYRALIAELGLRK